MSLVEKLLPIEKEFFLWLNDHHTPYWDTYVWMFSEKLVWIPLALVSIVVFIFKIKWKEALLIILCSVLIGVLCDYIVGEFVKPYFERFRPGHHPDYEELVNIVNNERGGRYGFISNHAANAFGIMTFTSLLFKYRYFTLTILFYAVSTAYSRIYLGLHFISDVVGGAIWGTIVGLLVYYIYLTSRRYILKVPKEEVAIPVYSRKRAHVIMATIGAIVVFISIYSAIFDIPW